MWDWAIPSKNFNSIYPSFVIWRNVGSWRQICWLRLQFSSGVGLSWHKNCSMLSQWLGNYVTIIYMWRSICSCSTTLTYVVSRQFRETCEIVITKFIRISWGEIMRSLVIITAFAYEPHVIEILCRNPILILYVHRRPPRRHVSSEWHIGWILPKFKSLMGLSWHTISAVWMTGTLCTTQVISVFSVNALRTQYWLTWDHVCSCAILADNDKIDTHDLTRNPGMLSRVSSHTSCMIEVLIQNSVLLLCIRRWPSRGHISPGRHIGWLRPKLWS